MKVIILLAVIAAATAKPNLQTNGLFSYFPRLGIVNGHEAEPHQFPYQVALLVDTGVVTSLCGGSLISNNYVLTAAHCTESALSIQLIFGAVNFMKHETAQVRLNSSTFIIHSGYDASKFENDISLIKLPKPVKETGSIKIVRLAKGSDTYADKQGTVAGWGKVNDSVSTVSPTLQFITSRIMKNDECKHMNAAYNYIMGDSKMCLAGKDHGINVSTCQGDSGGPLIVDGVQVGLVSFGWKYCSIGLPSVLTRVNKHWDWIQANSDIKLAC